MSLLKIKITLDASQFKSEAGDAGRVAGEGSVKFDSFTAKAGAFAFAFNQIGAVVSQVGRLIAVPISKFSELESAMTNVATLGVENIDDMTDSVLNLGDEISVPLSNLSGGLFEVVSAGVDAANQIDVLEVSAKAARAGLTETRQALRLSSAVVKGYGLEWDTVESIMDRAFKTNELGQTTFPELADNMGIVVPLASALKIDIDELFGSFATLTGVTGNTSQVATQLRAVMTGLADPTKELSQLIENQTGLSVEQAVAQEGLAGILAILGNATGGSAAEMNKFFGRVEAVNAALALSSTQYDTLIEKTGAMTDSAGAMNDAFELQNDTIDGQIQLLENRWDRIMIRAVEVAVPFINSILDVAGAATDSRTEIGKLEDSISNLNNEMSQVEDVEKLLSRYQDLKEKTKLSKTEHEELRDIIVTLSNLYPSAITKLDDYGKAVGISAEKVRVLVNQQRALLKAQNQDILETGLKALASNLDLILQKNEKLANIPTTIRKTFRGDIVELNRTTAQIAEETNKVKQEAVDASNELSKGILLLSNFFDFDADKSTLATQLGLNGQQAELLIKRWKELNSVVDKAKQIASQPLADVDPGLKISSKPIEFPIKPIIKADSSGIAPKLLDRVDFTQELDFLDLMREAAIISDEDFFERRLALLQADLENAREINGERSREALEVQAELVQAEQDAAERKLEIQEQVIAGTVGQLATLMQLAQGSSQELFLVGKAAGIANATIDTFVAANKALSNPPGPPFTFPIVAATIVRGLATVAKIASTKFERRAKGGFLGDEIRTVLESDFGGGENRLIVANDGEFIVNASATARNRALLEAINAGTRSVPVSFAGGGPVTGGQVFLGGDLDALAERLSDAVRQVKINFKGTLDGQEFLRENFDDFQRIENNRRF